MPIELQQQVQAMVTETKGRSGWPARQTLRHLGISPSSYYRWGKEERWATDLMYIQVSGRTYYLVTFLNEYSRYIVHHELTSNMEGCVVEPLRGKKRRDIGTARRNPLDQRRV